MFETILISVVSAALLGVQSYLAKTLKDLKRPERERAELVGKVSEIESKFKLQSVEYEEFVAKLTGLFGKVTRTLGHMEQRYPVAKNVTNIPAGGDEEEIPEQIRMKILEKLAGAQTGSTTPSEPLTREGVLSRARDLKL